MDNLCNISEITSEVVSEITLSSSKQVHTLRRTEVHISTE